MDAAATYLVVIDDSPESRVAMRFAVLRAAHVGADVRLVSVVRPTEFMHFGAVQSMMAAEARDEAEALRLLLWRERVLVVTVEPETNLQSKLEQDGESNRQGRLDARTKRKPEWTPAEGAGIDGDSGDSR
jgi:nucleotide-binding universal stress UspA family protein